MTQWDTHVVAFFLCREKSRPNKKLEQKYDEHCRFKLKRVYNSSKYEAIALQFNYRLILCKVKDNEDISCHGSCFMELLGSQVIAGNYSFYLLGRL